MTFTQIVQSHEDRKRGLRADKEEVSLPGSYAIPVYIYFKAAVGNFC